MLTHLGAVGLGEWDSAKEVKAKAFPQGPVAFPTPCYAQTVQSEPADQVWALAGSGEETLGAPVPCQQEQCLRREEGRQVPLCSVLSGLLRFILRAV